MDQQEWHRWRQGHRIVAKAELEEALDQPSGVLLWLLPALLIWVGVIAAACLLF